ncbi:MAG: pilus assembly protein PilM, partial [Candidatus Terrybacteria bacterium]|nr:pilus assembly protein PilM [Candidatus Terrybacteria bacterium]
MDPLRVILQEYPVAGLEIGERSLRLVLLALKTPEKQRVPKPQKPKRGTKAAPAHNVLPLQPPTPPQNTKAAIQIAALAEETLAEGIIAGGVIRKPELLAQALTRLRRRAQNASRYVIASVPADIIYTRIFTFPGTISGKRLEETMQLTAGFQLPKAPEEMYLDWEEAKSKRDEKAVLL